MLNTDLHNPSIPEAKKMKLDGFIRNNHGIDDGNVSVAHHASTPTRTPPHLPPGTWHSHTSPLLPAVVCAAP